MIDIWSPNEIISLDHRDGETLREALMRSGLPLYAMVFFDEQDKFLSLADSLNTQKSYRGVAVRNPDLSVIEPTSHVIKCENPVSELFLTQTNAWKPALVQFSMKSGRDFIFNSFNSVIDGYLSSNPTATIQVALSSGGDGRMIAECIHNYKKSRSDVQFYAVITSTAFEDEKSHIDAALDICRRFDIPWSVFDNEKVARFLGYQSTLDRVAQRYGENFPDDEIEVLGTYWVQEINLRFAKDNGHSAVIYGFNQEDAIAERLYQALSGTSLDHYPVRKVGNIDLIAPLHQVPKRLIDSMDRENSERNYELRMRSVSSLRSATYFIAYHIAERFPALARHFAGTPLKGENIDAAKNWLNSQQF